MKLWCGCEMILFITISRDALQRDCNGWDAERVQLHKSESQTQRLKLQWKRMIESERERMRSAIHSIQCANVTISQLPHSVCVYLLQRDAYYYQPRTRWGRKTKSQPNQSMCYHFTCLLFYFVFETAIKMMRSSQHVTRVQHHHAVKMWQILACILSDVQLSSSI